MAMSGHIKAQFPQAVHSEPALNRMGIYPIGFKPSPVSRQSLGQNSTQRPQALQRFASTFTRPLRLAMVPPKKLRLDNYAETML
jgi:hypothetical protein